MRKRKGTGRRTGKNGKIICGKGTHRKVVKGKIRCVR